MRPLAGLVALNGLFLVAGYGLLYGLGLARRAPDARLYGGLALPLGFVVVSAAVALALTAGASGGILDAALAAAGFALAGVLLARRVPRRRPPPPRPHTTGLERFVVVGSLLALIVYYGALLRRALLSDGPLYWDPWWFWLPKARTILLRDGLEGGPGGFTSWANPDYPPLVPGFDALLLRFVGSVELRWLALELWVLEVGFVAAVAALLARRVPSVVLWPLLTLVALLPGFRYLMASFLADELLTIEFGLAALVAALWIVDRDARWAALCTLFLSAALLTKSEGSLLYAVLVSLVVALTLSRRTIKPLLALVALPPLALLPWKLWLRANDVPPTPAFHPTDLFDPGYLADRAERLPTAVADILSILVDLDQWLILVPLVFAAAALAFPVVPRLALFQAGLLVLGFAGIVAVYWASPYDLEYLINTSASRVVAPVAVACALILPLTLGAAFAPPASRRARPTRARAPARRR